MQTVDASNFVLCLLIGTGSNGEEADLLHQRPTYLEGEFVYTEIDIQGHHGAGVFSFKFFQLFSAPLIRWYEHCSVVDNHSVCGQ